MKRGTWVTVLLTVIVLATGTGVAIRACRNVPALPTTPVFRAGWELPKRPVRVVTFNIEFGNRLEEALEIVRVETPDVVCLQEIRPNQVRTIEKALAMEGAWFTSSNLIQDGAWGNAVFARGRVTEAQSIPNPGGGSFGMWAAVELDGARFLAGSIHLMHAKTAGAGFATREREIRALVDALGKAGGPAIVAGDFNNPPAGENYDLLTGALTDLGTGAGGTFPSKLPLLRIDYVFATREWEAESAKVISTTVSDHRPLVVVAKVK